MGFTYNIHRITGLIVRCRCLPVSYRSCFSNFSTVTRIIGEENKPRLRVENEASTKQETVLRISKGNIELIEGSKCDDFESDLQLEVLSSVPQIDKDSFKNYIKIPPQGISSIFSQKDLRLFVNDVIPFKQYVEGSHNAHHYPLNLLPRKLSMKLSSDIIVTTYSAHEKDYKVENGRRIKLSTVPTLKTQPNEVLLQKLYGKNTILIVFSGNIPHSDAKSAIEWKDVLTLGAETHIVLNAPCPVGMSYFHKRYLNSLATALVERNNFSCITRKLTPEETIAFHQYRRQFASLLVIDKFGYIRWHAVGRPTREAKYLLKEAYEQLLCEV